MFTIVFVKHQDPIIFSKIIFLQSISQNIIKKSFDFTNVKDRCKRSSGQYVWPSFLDELPDDLNVGLVSFAGTAQLLVPPTQDHESIKTAIGGLELDKATAIGDAVKLSLEVIADQAVGVTDGVPDAAIVLISDGETTVGLPPPEKHVVA